ncbi:MAG: hypothetical protein R3D59_14445 [Paracoccaceae bacterium]
MDKSFEERLARLNRQPTPSPSGAEARSPAPVRSRRGMLAATIAGLFLGAAIVVAFHIGLGVHDLGRRNAAPELTATQVFAPWVFVALVPIVSFPFVLWGMVNRVPAAFRFMLSVFLGFILMLFVGRMLTENPYHWFAALGLYPPVAH